VGSVSVVVFSWFKKVEAVGIEPAKGAYSQNEGTGQAPDGGGAKADESQAGQSLMANKGDESRTEADATHTDTGKQKCIKYAVRSGPVNMPTDLARIVDTWPHLSDEIRRRILALITLHR